MKLLLCKCVFLRILRMNFVHRWRLCRQILICTAKKNPPLSEEGDQLLQLIALQIRRLSHLSEELLELSSLKQSDCDEVIHLDQLVGDVIEDLSLRIASKNLAVHYHPEHLLMRGSAELLYRAVYNVVENAVKYSEKKGTVEIALFYEAGRNVVQVADEGCGIEQGEEEKIFEPFYRGKQTVKDGEGLGLGAGICQIHCSWYIMEISMCRGESRKALFLHCRSRWTAAVERYKCDVSESLGASFALIFLSI